jgi:hypothetical protein
MVGLRNATLRNTGASRPRMFYSFSIIFQFDWEAAHRMDAAIAKLDDVPAGSSRRWKKRKNPWGPHTRDADAPEQPSTPTSSRPSAFTRVPPRKRSGPVPVAPLTYVGPVPQIPGSFRVVIPGPVVAVPMSATPIRNPELLRENYAIVMKRMFFTPPKQEHLVEIQMIKKPHSFLNLHCPYYGRIILPVLEVPTTFTVWIKLDISGKIIRAPLDHFRIVNNS